MIYILNCLVILSVIAFIRSNAVSEQMNLCSNPETTSCDSTTDKNCDRLIAAKRSDQMRMSNRFGKRDNERVRMSNRFGKRDEKMRMSNRFGKRDAETMRMSNRFGKRFFTPPMAELMTALKNDYDHEINDKFVDNFY